ncbi:MAG TPA: GNAT family N-acetyltransferase [Permianibacter sp.]|nr:GNAT family N-acetyltransferase [Permianibacter sp.]
MAEIQTRRLRLRQWQLGDADPFAAMVADPEVMRYFPATLTRPQSDALLAKLHQRIDATGYGFWATERRDTGEFIGFVGLNVPDHPLPFAPCVEIGWRLVRSAWGQGLASEAARAALRFGFDTLKLGEVVSFTSQHNLRSQAVMQRIGMRRDPGGDFLHPKLASDHWLAPHVLYRLTATDWQRGFDCGDGQ